MTAQFPEKGLRDWDDELKAYIDAMVASAVAAAGTAKADALAALSASRTDQPRYVPRDSLAGPAATDITNIAVGAAGDASFNEQYLTVGGNALPAVWPVDAFGRLTVANSAWSAKTHNNSIVTSSTYRFMCDGDSLALFTYSSIFTADFFIDGRPWANNPVTLAVSTGYSPYGFVVMTFPNAKPRLIEMRTTGGLNGVYTKKPYRVWKPPKDPNPTIAVQGDSFTAPTVYQDAAAGVHPTGYYDLGIWQRMGPLLGVTSLVTDGVGGTGVINGGGNNVPYGHANRMQWISDVNPDVFVVHGGGANDIYQGNTDAAIIAAFVTHFKNLRQRLPKAKLVFVEGFSPPLFTPATFNPRYTAIRQGVQQQLATDGLKNVYYLDVATTRPPILGSGYVTAANASGNSDIYVGSDGVHLTARGNDYCRRYLAPKMRRVLADDGRLDGQLIL